MTQKQRVLDYCRQHGSITSMEAINHLGCTRLAAQIAVLKKDGYRVHTTKEQGYNRFGEKAYFARYYILPPLEGVGNE